MKIKIIRWVGVSAIHGVSQGRIFEIIEKNGTWFEGDAVWVKGDADEEVKIWAHEYEIIKSSKK